MEIRYGHTQSHGPRSMASLALATECACPRSCSPQFDDAQVVLVFTTSLLGLTPSAIVVLWVLWRPGAFWTRR
jgi:hypothetical protein